MDTKRALATSSKIWDESIVPCLQEYIRIPNMSPNFDPDWKKNGHMDEAVSLFVGWAERRSIPSLEVEVLQLKGKTPLIFMEIPSTGGIDENTVLLYGHLDKQPPMPDWRDGLGPWTPVIEDEKLYGRGGADDGYAMFASLTAIQLLVEQNLPYSRIVVLIEASEESGSPDLPAYIEAFADKIGTPDLVICLDSGCGNYDQVWLTTSLRGMVSGDLKVRILTEGVHSGNASGIVPDSFRIIRELLGRIENPYGTITLQPLLAEIPQERRLQAHGAARVLGSDIYDSFPWVPSAKPVPGSDIVELLLRKTWRPMLTVIGIEGFPPSLNESGNVLRPETTVRLSMRLPPTVDAQVAADAMKFALEQNPPYGAEVTFTPHNMATGWDAPPLADWLGDSLHEASMDFFGRQAVAYGEGGGIPFMGMLGNKFPQAQFVITGVLGPHSNAHGPNEFLHIPTGKRLTAAIAKVITDFAQR